MNILEKFFKDNNPQPDKIHERVENIQSVIEETDEKREIARKKAVEFALETIEKHPEMPVGTFLQKLQEDTSLTDNDIATIIKHLADIKSEKAVIAAVQATDLPSEAIATIARKANISTDTAEKIVEEIEDKEIQREQQKRIANEREHEVLNQLSKIYSSCNSIEAPRLVELLEEIDIRDYTEKIQRQIMSIIAKRTALDCMRFGGPRIPTLTRAVSSLDMFEYDLPNLTYNEYKTLRSDFDIQRKPYKKITDATQELIHDKILEDISKNLAHNFDTVGDFGLPQTERFKHLSSQDIEKVVKTVKTYSELVDKLDLKRLAMRLHGKTDTSLENAFKEIELHILELPTDAQLPATQVILEALEQQKEAMKLISNVKKTDTQANHDDLLR